MTADPIANMNAAIRHSSTSTHRQEFADAMDREGSRRVALASRGVVATPVQREAKPMSRTGLQVANNVVLVVLRNLVSIRKLQDNRDARCDPEPQDVILSRAAHSEQMTPTQQVEPLDNVAKFHTVDGWNCELLTRIVHNRILRLAHLFTSLSGRSATSDLAPAAGSPAKNAPAAGGFPTHESEEA